jgi:hypothetical protein
MTLVPSHSLEPPPDADLSRRRALLAGVAARLRTAGIGARFEALESYLDLYGRLPAGVTGLVCPHPTDAARMQITVVRAERTAPAGLSAAAAGEGSWVPDLALDYDLGGDGDLFFEMTTLEDPDDGLGHSRETAAQRTLTDDEQGVLDAVWLWHGYRETLRCARPPARPDRERTRLRRELAARRAAASAARVRVTVDPADVPPGGLNVRNVPNVTDVLAADLARLDAGQLCFHFPRDRLGRYARRAAVALAGYDPDPARRAPWLVARADGDTVVVGIESVIGVNQDHRWDATPWLWSDAHRTTPPQRRWQVPYPDHAGDIVRLLDDHAVAEAMTMAGVTVDADLAALLDGYPTRYRRAVYTDRWVGRLYEQLRGCAPWRFAAAYQVWQRERRELRRPATGPTVLFGLGGVNQQRRPTVALDVRQATPHLRMVWTASNARLPHALWRRPADLDAALLPDG